MPGGTGTARLYSFADLVALRVARQLRAAGFSLQSLRQVVDYLRERKSYNNPLARVYLICVDGDLVERNENELISLIKNRGQKLLWFIDLEDMRSSLFKQAKTAEKPKRGPASQVVA